MPPRCNPISIIIMVLLLGMIFIGLTMTVIAHWPGNSSIGENPLKIAGPVLLTVGGVAFIVGMIVICMWQSSQKSKWQQTMQQVAASRSNMYNAQSMEIKPGPGILKTPSISTYGKGSEYGDDYNYQYSDQPGYPSQGGYDGGYKTDPYYPPGYTANEPSATDLDGQVPVPVRQITKKKPRPAEDAEVLVKDDQRQMQSYPSQEGFDAYNDGKQKPETKPRSRKKKPKEEPKPAKDTARDSSHSNDGYEHDHHTGYYANVPTTPGSQYSYNDQGALSGAGGMGLAGMGGGLAGSGLAGMGAGYSPGGNMEQQLKINIRAQPNTAVHITPGTYHTTPPQPHQPYNKKLNMSQSSVETEI